ncbi:MAG TPA: XRE family transcriptional regulator [bacterium]|nr:XRE family transcriptional regulator [bacterium]HNT67199.1 XRE family transcriptional regulator [bacterium]
MEAVFAQRLKSARVMQGFSMAELAARMGNRISKQAIGKYEKGLAVPNSENLIALARALSVKLDYFFRPELIKVKLGPPVYRKRQHLSKKSLARIRETVQEQVERYLQVESLFPPQRFPAQRLPDLVTRQVKSFADVEELAVKLRKTWNLGLDPIDNLVQTLEDRHVIVVLLPEIDHFDGLSCWANESIPVVVSKKTEAGDRLRFTVAHELGHLLIDAQGIDEEKAAQRFAAAFLVPATVVRQELGESRRVISGAELQQLKIKYGTSMQMWIYRARDLGIISESHAQEWFIAFRRIGHRQEPGAPIEPEEPMRFHKLVFQALAEDLISESRATEFLNWNIDRIREKMLGDFHAVGA